MVSLYYFQTMTPFLCLLKTITKALFFKGFPRVKKGNTGLSAWLKTNIVLKSQQSRMSPTMMHNLNTSCPI